MSFFDRWARAIAAGDVLTRARMRPWHGGHQAIARDALAAMGAPDPGDDEAGQQLWDRWLGANYHHYLMQAPLVGRVGLDFRLVGPLALVGLLLGVRRSAVHALAFGWLGVGVVSTVLFFHLSRFRAPYVPVLLPFAAWTLVALARTAARRQLAHAAAVVLLIAGAGLVVWRPLPPGESPIRIADVAVPNLIATGLARERLAAGDVAGAARLVERQIALEPDDLRRLDPATGPARLATLWAASAGSFAPLHALAAELDPARAADERRRAALLDAVGRQWAARFGDPGRRVEPTGPSP